MASGVEIVIAKVTELRSRLCHIVSKYAIELAKYIKYADKSPGDTPGSPGKIG